MNLASRGRRLGAASLDTVLALLCYVFFGSDAVPAPLHPVGGLALLVLVCVQVWWMASRGQTIGKRLLGLRIARKDTGENGGFKTNILMRGFVAGLPNLIPGYFVLDCLFIFRQDRRCLHDLIAGTIVVDGQPGAEAAAPTTPSPPA